MAASTHLSTLMVTEVIAPAAQRPLAPSPGSSRETAAISPTSLVYDFDDIYREHFAFIWRSARRLGVDPSFLDDVVQEVFVIVHRRLAGFEQRSTLRTWLFGITLRVARDHRRSRARKPLEPVQDPDLLSNPARSPHEHLERREAVRTLYSILNELSDEHREILVMADLEEMPMSDVAATLEINENTGYGRLRAARRFFDEALVRRRARDEWRLR